jgi:hypothetical protein
MMLVKSASRMMIEIGTPRSQRIPALTMIHVLSFKEFGIETGENGIWFPDAA